MKTQRQKKGVDGTPPTADELEAAHEDEPVEAARDDLIPIDQGKDEEETV